MFKNLRNTLHSKGISIKSYAELLGVTEKSVQNKLSGKTDFTLPEFNKTCTVLPEYNPTFLFTPDTDVPKTA